MDPLQAKDAIKKILLEKLTTDMHNQWLVIMVIYCFASAFCALRSRGLEMDSGHARAPEDVFVVVLALWHTWMRQCLCAMRTSAVLVSWTSLEQSPQV